MTFRCLLFSSDEETATLIFNVLAGLDVETEICAEAVASVEKVTSQSFRIVIIDWDMQPEAGLLLSAARERKAGDRPLTLAIVSDDASVPKALQAGANSILRRPIAIQQVKDTLKTARDLLRARLEPPPVAQAAAAGATAAGSTSTSASSVPEESDALQKKGEFLQPKGTSTLFEVESDMQKSMERSAASEVDALKDLEPMAAAVQKAPEPAPTPQGAVDSDEPRGLEWFLKRSTGGRMGAQMSAAAPARMPSPATPPSPPQPAKPELIGFDQTPSAAPSAMPPAEAPLTEAPAPIKAREQRTEATLFAYMDGEKPEPTPAASSHFRLGRRAILWAVALAACAIVAAPQAPWHGSVRAVWARGQQMVHGWLNPQLVTPAQAPASHENFARAGDEYKLPVAETIPDATTDPSQIRVTPVVDPTAKKPNDAVASPEATAPPDGSTTPTPDAKPSDPSQSATPPGQQQNAGPGSAGSGPAASNPAPAVQTAAGAASVPTTSAPSGPIAAAPVTATPTATAPASSQGQSGNPSAPAQIVPQPAPAKIPQTTAVAANSSIPSSLRTQLASSTPEASGNKAPEAAMDSIEPVVITETAARAQLTDQPAPAYPPTAKGQQGTVVLQVLIGRDGSVQDAKFLQGSLAFARSAIDAVKQWKFKPYIMNARPVSVQTQITIGFKPS